MKIKSRKKEIKNKAKDLLIKMEDVDSGDEKNTTLDRVWMEIEEFLKEIK